MRLAVLGAGAVGPAAAVLAASRGHDAVLWSPSGAGTAGIAGPMRAEGALAGAFALAIADRLEAALDGADAALLAVPAYAFPGLLPRLAAVWPDGLPLLIAPAAALSPLAFDALWAARGAPATRAPVGAMATTPVLARRLAPDLVRVVGVRAAVDLTALPAAAAPRMASLATALFGHACPIGPHVLQAGLANANPIIHAVLALTNVTRIEFSEVWPQYAMMTPAACRLMEALSAERARVASAYGVEVLPLSESLHRASGVVRGPLHEMAAAIAASSRAVSGPAVMDTRYVTEDVPFGLAFYLWLAARQDVALPATEAVVTALEALWGQGLRDNPLLAALEGQPLEALLLTGIGRG